MKSKENRLPGRSMLGSLKGEAWLRDIRRDKFDREFARPTRCKPNRAKPTDRVK